MRLLNGSDLSGLNGSSGVFFGRLGGSCRFQNPNAPREAPEKTAGKVAGEEGNNASRVNDADPAATPAGAAAATNLGALKDGPAPVQSHATPTTNATTRATRATRATTTTARTDRRRRAVSVGGDLDGDLGRAVACDVAMSPLSRMRVACGSTTANSPSTCCITTSSSHTSATRTNAFYFHATRSRDTRSGGASPAAAISPPPSSSFPATSVFLPALLRLGADLSDDPDDREQVVAQGFAHAQAKPTQGRRHRRTGSLDAMLLAKTTAGGQGVTFATVGVDFRTATTGGTNEDAGRHGTTTARSAAAIEAGSMAGGSKNDEAIPGEATSFPATLVSEESNGSGTSSSSSSSSSSRDDPTGFKGFQPVPTAAQPAAGSPKPAGFGSAKFSGSTSFKGFKPAFLRLGDDVGDDLDDWEWLAGGQQLMWSNPGGPLKGEACRDDDSSVAPAGPFGQLAPPIAAPTTTAAVATAPALPLRSPKPVAGPVAGSSSSRSEGQQQWQGQGQRQGQGQQWRWQQQHHRTAAPAARHSCDGSLQHATAPLFEAPQKSFLQHTTALSATFSGTAGSKTFEGFNAFVGLERLSFDQSHELSPGLSTVSPLRIIPPAHPPCSTPSARSWGAGSFFSGKFWAVARGAGEYVDLAVDPVDPVDTVDPVDPISPDAGAAAAGSFGLGTSSFCSRGTAAAAAAYPPAAAVTYPPAAAATYPPAAAAAYPPAAAATYPPAAATYPPAAAAYAVAAGFPLDSLRPSGLSNSRHEGN
ncbi:unnamed protein product [Closterium sp. NIES-53]